MNVSMILTMLKLALAIVTWLQQRKTLQAGHDKAIAEAAANILVTTETGKKLREDSRKATDEDADKLWDELINVA